METDFETLPFDKAVQLFETWGFFVEQGPRATEVTIILEGPSHRSFYACELEQVSKMASVILRQRMHVRAMGSSLFDVQ